MFIIKYAKYYANKMLRMRDKEIQNFLINDSSCAFASFDAFKGLRSKGSAEGRNMFLGPGYPHKDSRLPTYSDCMHRAVRCSPMARRRHGSSSALSFAAHKHANEDILRVYTRWPAGGGQRLVSVSLALRRAEKRSAYPRPALPLAT